MRYAAWLLTALLMALCTETYAYQLRLNGVVTDFSSLKPLPTARVRVYKEGVLQHERTSNSSGKYVITFDNHAEYVLRVDAPGYQGKSITIDTRGMEWEGDRRMSDLDVEIRLPELHNGVDLSFLDLPLGIAYFEPATGLTRWNRTYEKNIRPGMRDVMEQYVAKNPETTDPTLVEQHAKQRGGFTYIEL